MPIELIIVTPQGEAFHGPVDSVVLPGAAGEFEVLENHERFLSPLDIGAVEIKTAEGSSHAVIASPCMYFLMYSSSKYTESTTSANVEYR